MKNVKNIIALILFFPGAFIVGFIYGLRNKDKLLSGKMTKEQQNQLVQFATPHAVWLSCLLYLVMFTIYRLWA